MEQARIEAASTSSRSYAIQVVLLAVLLVTGVMAVVIVVRLSRQLRGVAARIREESKCVAAAARQVSSNGQALSEGASDQAAAIEQTSASTEEIHAMSRKSGENTQQAADLMAKVDREMQSGTAALDEVLTSMSHIADSSGNISKIIRVIDEIAFQTNILALNAAVEAARAGEAGTGFAVVAEEVRNLAGRCAQAAKDTEGLIESSLNQSRDGSAKVEKLSDVVKAIADGSRRAKTLIDEVQVASRQQSQGMHQIATAVARMEQVTQRTAAAAEEGAASSEELSAQAEALNSEATNLEKMVGTTELEK
jgi:methyl-accepting chemotaxis protein/methyl-accepting chemotaxis protein-1 (serine sensor receptor)